MLFSNTGELFPRPNVEVSSEVHPASTQEVRLSGPYPCVQLQHKLRFLSLLFRCDTLHSSLRIFRFRYFPSVPLYQGLISPDRQNFQRPDISPQEKPPAQPVVITLPQLPLQDIIRSRIKYSSFYFTDSLFYLKLSVAYVVYRPIFFCCGTTSQLGLRPPHC